MKDYNINKIMIVMGIFFGILHAEVVPSVETNKNLTWTISEKKLPLPSCASAEIQKTLARVRQPNVEEARKFVSKSNDEWKDWAEYARLSGTEGSKKSAEKYGVNIRKKMINGINTYELTPLALKGKDTKQLLIYLHGGAYIFGGGMSALNEAILIADRAQIPVVAIDFRMPPDHPFPAAQEDIVQVYKSLIQSHASTSLAIAGSSSGGGLALATIHKLKSLNLALPGALFIGTPWSDLTKRGDSLYVNEGIDRKIATYDGFLPEAAKLYANGHNLINPALSPVYGDFSGFPPTMLVSGTRDLFLSMTVRVHRKMKAAGVVADLNVYEGLSHVEYFIVPDAPESIEVYSELKKFLKQHLK